MNKIRSDPWKKEQNPIRSDESLVRIRYESNMFTTFQSDITTLSTAS